MAKFKKYTIKLELNWDASHIVTLTIAAKNETKARLIAKQKYSQYEGRTRVLSCKPQN